MVELIEIRVFFFFVSCYLICKVDNIFDVIESELMSYDFLHILCFLSYPIKISQLSTDTNLAHRWKINWMETSQNNLILNSFNKSHSN